MKGKTVRFILCMILAIAVSGCSTWQKGEPLPIKKSPIIDNGPRFSQKADAFLVILDASSSMDEVPETYNKFDTAKNILDRMNQMLPEYEMTAGLRSFGHHPDLSRDHTQLFYGMAPYHTGDFGRALDDIAPAGGTSPLEDALDAAIQDFEAISGPKAVIILSDGKKMSDRVLPAARKLAATYGNTLCIYSILMGNDPKGQALMTELAGLTTCGFLTRDTRLIDNSGLKTFVHNVFLKETRTDKDNSVTDSTRAPVPPGDKDRDGVTDAMDKCPDTPLGATVGVNGCWNAGDVFFGFDKYQIRPGGKAELDKVAGILRQNPGLRVKLQGHTCNIGGKVYNLGLSKRRADAVKDYLVHEGISAERIETQGVGFSMPLVPNTSAANRAMNRRTEIHPLK